MCCKRAVFSDPVAVQVLGTDSAGDASSRTPTIAHTSTATIARKALITTTPNPATHPSVELLDPIPRRRLRRP